VTAINGAGRGYRNPLHRQEPLRHLEVPVFNEPAQRTAIFALGKALQDAWNRGDAAGYASLFTDDADFVAWNGSYGRGRQAIEDGCGSSGVIARTGFSVVRGLVSGLPVSVRV
jgi:hypothetical protein